jgi:Zn-dependent protease with chaperone function
MDEVPNDEGETMKAPLARWVRGVLVLGLLCACGTLSVPEEKELGAQEQQRVRRQFQLLRDPVVVEYVRKLGANLVANARPSPFEFRFYVIEDANLNAFAVPGGAVYVHTGLILAAAAQGPAFGMRPSRFGGALLPARAGG